MSGSGPVSVLSELIGYTLQKGSRGVLEQNKEWSLVTSDKAEEDKHTEKMMQYLI